MDLFWRRGYQGTSMAALTEAMGIGSPSLYAAFGSKAELFCEAADLYERQTGARPAQELAAAASAREGFERMVRANVELFTRPDGPRGCLLTRAVSTCPPDDAEVIRYLERSGQERLRALEERLLQALADGEGLPADDVRPLAGLFDSVVQGLAVKAHEGDSADDLNGVVDTAMSAWDALLASRHGATPTCD